MFKPIWLLGLSISISVISLNLVADVENQSSKKRWSSVGITTGIESCTPKSLETIKASGKFTDPNIEANVVMYYCGCMVEALEALPYMEAIKQGPKCFKIADKFIQKAAKDNTVRPVNTFNKKDLPAAITYRLHLNCVEGDKKVKPERKGVAHDFFCSCLLDEQRESTAFRSSDYYKNGFQSSADSIARCAKFALTAPKKS